MWWFAVPLRYLNWKEHNIQENFKTNVTGNTEPNLINITLSINHQFYLGTSGRDFLDIFLWSDIFQYVFYLTKKNYHRTSKNHPWWV
jgi:hypothetical protein